MVQNLVSLFQIKDFMEVLNIFQTRLAFVHQILERGTELATIDEAAKIVGLKETSLRTQIGRGRVRTVKQGRRIYITLSELARLI